MRYRLLGRTGLYVSELCLGTMTFGGQGWWKVMGALGQDGADALVKQSFDAGVNFIDTANVYALGESETLTGNAIKRLGLPRDELVIATKATGVMSETAINARGQSRYHLMNALDASLKRLQLDHIDLYQLHGFDPLTPLDEVLGTLNDMVRSGKVRYIGLCNMAAWQIMKALAMSDKNGWARFESVQAYYTVAGRDLEREVVPLLQDQQLGLMVWSPLAGGLLSGKFSADGSGPPGTRRATFDFPVVDKPRAFAVVDAMRPIAQRHEVSVARVALAWLLSRPVVSSVILGARTPEQLTDNLAATQLVLSEEDLATLNAVSALPPEYPGWMLARQGESRAQPPVKA
ncbi:aldo/keto reductase [Rhodoferax sp.]|uniref:aldo/keto reductase n=1 Tax=Rhodoferax sp. TaxID=50421 RepID=UPI00284F13A5|nr:aldo/keto reductase [Rhodoferax sp.]MDR3370318.1 aldo/keto reductase [Rhodoferax sp.]